MRFSCRKQLNFLSYCFNREPAVFVTNHQIKIRSMFVVSIMTGIAVVNVRINLDDFLQAFFYGDVVEQHAKTEFLVESKHRGVNGPVERLDDPVPVCLGVLNRPQLKSSGNSLSPVLATDTGKTLRKPT